MRQPNIKTKRLLLRPLTKNDEQAVFAYAKLDAIGPKAGWEPHQSLKDTRRFINNALDKKTQQQLGVFAVVIRKTNQMIGTVEIHSLEQGYKAEIGMVCHPDHQNQGYMSEAAKAMIIYAFEHMKLRRLEYAHFPNNLASEKLRRKLNFREEGLLRNHFKRYDGLVLDFVVSSLTDDDYQEDYYDIYLPFKKDMTIYF